MTRDQIFKAICIKVISKYYILRHTDNIITSQFIKEVTNKCKSDIYCNFSVRCNYNSSFE